MDLLLLPTCGVVLTLTLPFLLSFRHGGRRRWRWWPWGRPPPPTPRLTLQTTEQGGGGGGTSCAFAVAGSADRAGGEVAVVALLRQGGGFHVQAFGVRDGLARGAPWDLGDVRPFAVAATTLPGGQVIQCLVALVDGRVLVLQGGTTTKATSYFTLLKELHNHVDAARCVTFLDGPEAMASGGWDHIVHVIPNLALAQSFALTGHTLDVNCLGYSRELDLLVSGSTDRTCRTWRVDRAPHTHQVERILPGCVFENHTDSVRALDVRGKWCCSGSFDFTVRVWDLETGSELIKLALTWFVLSVAWCSEDTILSASYDNKAVLFELCSPLGSNGGGAREKLIMPHTTGVNAVAVDPRGHWALTGCEGSGTLVWDLKAEERAQVLALLLCRPRVPVEIHMRVARFLI